MAVSDGGCNQCAIGAMSCPGLRKRSRETEPPRRPDSEDVTAFAGVTHDASDLECMLHEDRRSHYLASLWGGSRSSPLLRSLLFISWPWRDFTFDPSSGVQRE